MSLQCLLQLPTYILPLNLFTMYLSIIKGVGSSLLSFLPSDTVGQIVSNRKEGIWHFFIWQIANVSGLMPADIRKSSNGLLTTGWTELKTEAEAESWFCLSKNTLIYRVITLSSHITCHVMY